MHDRLGLLQVARMFLGTKELSSLGMKEVFR